MEEKLTISKEKPTERSMDFQFLRDQGLKHIEDLGSKIWTDYNVHDPGITILEVLCYAITDLGYRASFDIKDLLAEPDDSTNPPQFFTAKEVLTSNPVTETDFRKVLIDIPHVKNAWVYITQSPPPKIYADIENMELRYNGEEENALLLKGMYNVLLELDDDVDPADTAMVDSIKKAAQDKLHKVRNLCEDYLLIDVVGIEKISLCAKIEVSADAQTEDILADIYFRTHQFLSPSVKIYTLEEMLEKDKNIEEIFDGPLLDQGFIDTQELEASILPDELHVSDLYREIMKVDGVQSIKNLFVLRYDSNDNPVASEPWCMRLNPPLFKARLDTELSSITFYKGNIPLFADNKKALGKFEAKIGMAKSPVIRCDENDLSIPKGIYHELTDYTSIQEEFPLTYGIGTEGLPDFAGDLRKAQAKQLKGYLTFFDQLLADYLAQLSRVKDLLSVHNTEDSTYFGQPLYDTPGINELLVDYTGSDDTDWEAFKSDANNGYITALETQLESDETKWDRRNRFLDHLMARFGERFNDYALLMYDVYEKKVNENLVNDKEDFLKDYPVISQDRGRAFDYTAWDQQNNRPDVWDTFNVSGLEARIARLLGIDNYRRRHLYCEPAYTIEVSPVTPMEDPIKYHYRLKDTQGTLLLTSTEQYDTQKSAEEDATLLEAQLLKKDNYEVKKVNASQYRLFVKKDNTEYLACSEELFDSNIEASTLKGTIMQLACPEQDCSEEGFHLVEHILLRPLTTDYLLMPVHVSCADCLENADPYSFRITIVLPFWPKRFQDWRFRKFFEETTRNETPAHLAVKICWVSCLQMREFEEAYKDWLEEKSRPRPDQEELKNCTNTLINVLLSLRNVHKEARLHDCKTTEDALVLGYSNLGQI